MRLDKFISHATKLSRTESRKALKAGRVQLNHHLVTDPAVAVNDNDEITFDEAVITIPSPRYYMLNKPAGYVCANSDSQHPTVFDLLNGINNEGLSIAGRLDVDSTGLVLLSDDGQWIHRVTAPRTHCDKYYEVELAEPIREQDIRVFQQGMMLDDDDKPTLPAQLIPQSPLPCGEPSGAPCRIATVVINEGRYHQIKRMFAAVGNRVVNLHRKQVGTLPLDANLAPGAYRALTGDEVNSFTRNE